MSSLFLSYRRADSPGTVNHLYDRLKARMPGWTLFYDHTILQPGEVLSDRLRHEVTSAEVVLVVIGPRWIGSLKERLNQQEIDHLREEVRLALAHGHKVVPLLVEKASMPTEAELVDFPVLQPLCRLIGQILRPDPDFDADFERLASFLDRIGPGVGAGSMLGGKYKILREIGQGGMGVVFEAEQQTPRRTVAIKMVLEGMDTKEVLARFDGEKEALARMDHPNITGVIDSGSSPTGKPYFVMEFVRGEPITTYCDRKRLSPQERLKLFRLVCSAVQHAHQKGIIHRDIKPSNVLVEEVDGQPIPKVIDFGLAKALAGSLTNKTLVSETGRTVGTLIYASPEQAAGRSYDIDTRTDVYSLGVLIYELLVGAPPFTEEELLQVGVEAMRRDIVEREPSKPSTKLSSSNALPSIAANRQLDPGKLTRLVRGELDWIVMRALEKEPKRRYETAIQFGDDIESYLRNRPVRACPPSATYRLRKFVRRNRNGLLAAGTVITALVLAAAGVGWALWDRAAKESERRAELTRRIVETERAVAVALTNAQQSEEKAKQLPCKTSTEAKVQLAQWRDADASLAEAEAAMTTGEAAQSLRERVDDLRLRITSGRTQTTRKETLFRELDNARMALVTLKGSLFDYEGATAKYAAAFTQFGLEFQPGHTDDLAQRIRDQEPPVRDALMSALHFWAHCTSEKPVKDGLLTLAGAVDQDLWRRDYRKAAQQHDSVALVRLGADARRTPSQAPTTLELLALDLDANGKHQEALELLRWARGVYPSDFWIAIDLGNLLEEDKRGLHGELDEQVGCYRVAVALQPEAASAHLGLGSALQSKQLLKDAIAEFTTAVMLDPGLPWAHNNLGNALQYNNQLDEAIAEFNKAIALDPSFAMPHHNLGRVFKQKGQLDDAITKFKKAIALDPKLVVAHLGLGMALHDKRQWDEATSAYKKAIDLDPQLAEAHAHLGNLLTARNQLDDALAELNKAITLDPKLALAHFGLGAVFQTKNQLDEAIAEYNKALAIDSTDKKAYLALGGALLAKQQPDAAITEFKKAIALDPLYAKTHYYLGAVFLGNSQPADAIEEFKKTISLEPKDANAQYMLGLALFLNGQFAEGKMCFERAILIVPEKDPLRAKCLDSGNQCDAMMALEKKMVKVLAGKAQAKDSFELRNFIDICKMRRRHIAAAKLSSDLFTADAELANDLEAGHRFKAASFASLAAARQGSDSDRLTDQGCTVWRKQALQWLGADLEAWTKELESDADEALTVERALTRWKRDSAFTSVRDARALAQLPQDERKAWQKLWQDVDTLLARSQKKK